MADRFVVEVYGLNAATLRDGMNTKVWVARLCRCGGRTPIKVANEALKARKFAQGVEVVILLYPDRKGGGVDPRQAGFERIECGLRFAEQRHCASDVVVDAWIIGIDGLDPQSPLLGAFGFAQLRKGTDPADQCI